MLPVYWEREDLPWSQGIKPKDLEYRTFLYLVKLPHWLALFFLLYQARHPLLWQLMEATLNTTKATTFRQLKLSTPLSWVQNTLHPLDLSSRHLHIAPHFQLLCSFQELVLRVIQDSFESGKLLLTCCIWDLSWSLQSPNLSWPKTPAQERFIQRWYTSNC